MLLAAALGAAAGLCMIPGWERDIRHAPDNTRCIHVVGLLPVSPEEVPVTEARRYEVNEIPDQQLLDEMGAAGQFVILCHPRWSRMTPAEVVALTGFDAVEVFNTGCERLMHAGHAGLYWDALLEEEEGRHAGPSWASLGKGLGCGPPWAPSRSLPYASRPGFTLPWELSCLS